MGQDYTLFGKIESEKYERAEFFLKMAKNIQPGTFYPRYLLIALYERMDQKVKIKDEAQNLLSLKTKVESIAADEMKSYARKILEENRKSKHRNSSLNKTK